ncbi:hypothetical protein Trydic_g22403 [Trypoxylus dichotomus]
MGTSSYATKSYIPYIKGTTDKVDRILRKHYIQIEQILYNLKDKIPLDTQRVYEILCRNCNISYIGQTNGKICVRKEHKLAARAKQTQDRQDMMNQGALVHPRSVAKGERPEGDLVEMVPSYYNADQ